MHRYYGSGTLRTWSEGTAPFRCDGYLESGTLGDGQGQVIPLAELPPFLRALLVTDGTVTKILEAFFWEPVGVDTLEQRFEVAAAPVPWIALKAGESCLIRDARLRGLHTGQAYAEAFSAIRTELIPEDFRRRLIDREIGIGALIRDSGLESYREVLDVGLKAEPAGATSVYRTYRIVIDRQPVILITEHFPLELYRGTHSVPPGTDPRPPTPDPRPLNPEP